MSKPNPIKSDIDDARCLWATIHVYTPNTVPREYILRWNALPADVREQAAAPPPVRKP